MEAHYPTAQDEGDWRYIEIESGFKWGGVAAAVADLTVGAA